MNKLEELEKAAGSAAFARSELREAMKTATALDGSSCCRLSGARRIWS